MADVDSKSVQKSKVYRWIGLIIGLVLGLVASFGYYKWVENKAGIYFQKNIGESEFQVELKKWQMKNPQQAAVLATETQKILGIYEEVKNETNPEIIQQKALKKMQEISMKRKKEVIKKTMKIYQEYAPAFLEKLEKKFPWYLRYYWLVIILLVLASSGVGFLVGYRLESKKEEKIQKAQMAEW